MSNAKIATQVKNAFATIESAIDSRIANAQNDNQRKELQTSKSLFTVHLATVLVNEKADVKEVARIIAIEDKNAEDFFAQKAMIKFFKLVKTLSQDIDNLDRYTRNYLRSMLILKGSATNDAIQKGLSKAIALDENTVSLRGNQLHIATTTASTQASSTRKMLQYANVITYDKASKTQSFVNADMQARIAKIVKFES